ncbi:hydroxymethylbilane synthase [Methylotenera sp.]|uniref:hydroxymethylbilane synthase n=1 Tax=Methylotenera sp. TaxID=2051956 RepID=UPI002727FCBC|nr:hydroxymethylbilane synthase [Methylotenera sp.]MDO9205751.1 hydroxymethylbilane synthase [Methylotenera sp.]MDO9394698.1 hydroxymethylbilane synthase [Methylotenera sp.]MDP1522928.1 hydroxymethylbilane synthase [Methylotenera sp.]MDP2072393.1 hydroxymethylbilane synthase [Methylotenera sp.]MDP3005636.1 hydroxymethylbilane synthase [Methylotenera sp.]
MTISSALSSSSTTQALGKLVIASRESPLAMWQALHIQSRLQALYPETIVEILGMTTTGDQILDTPLAKVGGKGLFVKELEMALADGRADLAVHSMKDVPMNLPEGFMLVATAEREDPRDAFVSNDFASLEDLPLGSIVGTSSLRRQSQLQARLPHLKIESLRGNLQTRLRKLDEGQYDAIILAAAGLIRLGLGARIRDVIAPELSIPAVGQGALGIEINANRPDLIAILAPLNHPDTQVCVEAERAMSRALAGSCTVPLGAYATCEADHISITGFVASVDGKQMLIETASGNRNQADALGKALANQLLAKGADEILSALDGHK